MSVSFTHILVQITPVPSSREAVDPRSHPTDGNYSAPELGGEGGEGLKLFLAEMPDPTVFARVQQVFLSKCFSVCCVPLVNFQSSEGIV